MEQHRQYRVRRWLLGTGSLLLLAWGMAPLFTSRIHVGCVALMAAGGAGAWRRPGLRPGPEAVAGCLAKKRGRAVLTALLTLAGSLGALFVVVSGMMIAAACTPPPGDATVIVLGAGLRGDRPARDAGRPPGRRRRIFVGPPERRLRGFRRTE